MRKSDCKNEPFQRSDPPSPFRAKYYHGNKVIIIADANDRQIEALISALFGNDSSGIMQ